MTTSRLGLKLKKKADGQFAKGYKPWNKGKFKEKAHTWKGGISRLMAIKVLKEYGVDLTKCQICEFIKENKEMVSDWNKKSKSKKMIKHHIDGNEKNNDIKNLSVLCYSCHNAIHDSPTKKANRFQEGHLQNKHELIIAQ